MRDRTVQIGVYVAAILVFLAGTIGASEPINASGGVAIHGYDPVAYFTEGGPVVGDPQFSYRWSGTEWRFSSRENMELFQDDPERYAPAYGGYCAWAVSRGSTADIDPDQWVIEDDRLFLNFSGWTQRRFNGSLERNIRSADENWPEIRSQLQE